MKNTKRNLYPVVLDYFRVMRSRCCCGTGSRRPHLHWRSWG